MSRHRRVRYACSSTLLDAGAAAGTLRADADPEDVTRVINGI